MALRGEHGHEAAVADVRALRDANRVNACGGSASHITITIAAGRAAHGANRVNVQVARARAVDECNLRRPVSDERIIGATNKTLSSLSSTLTLEMNVVFLLDSNTE